MERYTLRTFLLEVVMIATCLVFMLPLYVLVNQAFKSSTDLSSPLAPVTSPTTQNFVDAWTKASLPGALGMSALVTISSVLILVFISAMAAYPLARSTRRWSSVAFYTFMIGLLLPFQLAMVPLYLTMRDLHLLGTPLALIIYYSGHQAPFSIFLFTTFLRAQPAEYEEAAAVDGCGSFRTFWGVVFPLLRPVTGTVVILNVLAIWNDFFTPLLYLSGSGNATIPVALYSFVGEYVAQWNLVFAGLLVTIIPILVVYFLLQKTVIRGFASGLKG